MQPQPERRKWRSVARILAHARAVRHHSIDHRLIADGVTVDGARGFTMNRRSVLGIATMTAMGLAFSRARAFAQASGLGPTMNTLSTYMSAAGARALPIDVAEQAKYHLIDTLATMISGSELLPGEAAALHPRARRKGRGDDRGLGAHGRGRRRRACERRNGACR
jgi:hypothetical protein